MLRLDSKVALVTGAAHGIGAAIAQAFRDEGATVYASDLAETACVLDVRVEADWQRVTADILRKHQRLDIVVNNAGITGFESGAAAHDPEHATLASWRAVHETNTHGTFLGCKHAIRAMRQAGHGGSIINISSRSGLVGIPGAAAYAASKAAIRNHTKSVALYCAGQRLGIRCNAIFPAAILTDMWQPLLAGLEGEVLEQRMQAFVADTPLQRFGQPSEVAAIAMLLASDEATYVTGAEFVIDGGLLAGSAAAPGR
ncbi:SDR family oxidoreductase [Novosphingobium sp.]|uniref:SDR family oxidoreductase n=1 Tax=Novosphingobium sp. TaxID=1874826 RepID=UPI003B51CA2D